MKNMYKRLFITLSLLIVFQGIAAAAEPVAVPLHSNPVFYVMLVTILILFLVIIGLASTIKNLADANRQKIRSDKSKGMATSLLIGLILVSGSLMAQEAAVAEVATQSSRNLPDSIAGIDSWVFLALLIAILTEGIIIFGLLRSVNQLLSGIGNPSRSQSTSLINWKWLDRKLTDAVPLENEITVMTDHDYDGIRELDNNLPPWWKYGFYFTIIFSVVYLVSYHITKSSPLQLQEYQTELTEAAALKGKQLKTAGASVDENSVTSLTDPAMIASGMEIFKGNCVSCHGPAGGGGVGPNLTDEYWINGGGIKNVFKVIKYGVPAKGMISWQQSLKPEAIQKVASYVLSLKGSKPANGKDPQGEIWKGEAESAAPVDTTKSISQVNS